MSETKVQPALSAEDWNRVLPTVRPIRPDSVTFAGEREGQQRGIPALKVDANDDRHALAALALHGQPFGFTREDVRLLRGLAMYGSHYESMRTVRAITQSGAQDKAEQWPEGSIEADIEALAARIEALLPPEV